MTERNSSRKRLNCASRSRSSDRYRLERRHYRNKSRSRSGSRSRTRTAPRNDRYRSESDGTPSNVLGVFGLSADSREKELENLFGKYGHITDINIIYDGKTKISRGFGFVYYASIEDAIEAKKALHGYELDGCRIRVDFSLTKEPHQRTPGIYMGFHDQSRHRNDYSRRRTPQRQKYRRSRSRSRSRSGDRRRRIARYYR